MVLRQLRATAGRQEGAPLTKGARRELPASEPATGRTAAFRPRVCVMLALPAGIHTPHDDLSHTSGPRAVHAAGARAGSPARLRGAHAGAGAGLAGHRRRRARAHLGAHGVRQDPCRLPVGARPLRRRAAAGRTRERRTRLVYVSPLKALGYDVERNLRAPLRGIGGRRARARVRTGDTPQRERREHAAPPARHPHHHARVAVPDAHLAGARELFAGTEWVIVDEIHAVAQTKRGAHLALTLERLAEAAGRDVQRIGLSATQRPLEEVGRFLVGPRRECTDRRRRRAQAARPAHPRAGGVDGRAGRAGRPGRPSAGGEATRAAIWPAIYPELLRLVREHRSTLIFVNNRRAAERLALRLNELAEEKPAARARTTARSRAKSVCRRGAAQGRRAAVPGGHLVARAGHRHGRRRPGGAGRVAQVGDPRPAAHRPRRPRRGRRVAGPHLPQVPRRPARVRRRGAAHARGARSRRRWCPATRSTCWRSRSSPWPRSPGTVALASTSCTPWCGAPGPYADLERAPARERARHARRPLPLGGVRRAAAAHRLGPRRPARSAPVRGARAAGGRQRRHHPRPRAVHASTCRTAAASASSTRRWSTRRAPGRRSCSAPRRWRIEEITRDRVVVTPAPGVPGAVPFWHGDGIGPAARAGPRPSAPSPAGPCDQTCRALAARLRPRRARRHEPARRTWREQQAATGVVPSRPDHRRRALPRRDRRLAAVRALALRRARARRLGAGAGRHAHPVTLRPGGRRDLVRRRHHRPPARRRRAAGRRPRAHRRRRGSRTWSSPSWATARCSAPASARTPRARCSSRAPAPAGARRSGSSASRRSRCSRWRARYAEFPIILETYRECLRDVLDVPGLLDLLRKLHTREIALVEVETPHGLAVRLARCCSTTSPPTCTRATRRNAERRAAALVARPRPAARAARAGGAARPHRPGRARAGGGRSAAPLGAPDGRDADALHDVLRRVGDLTLRRRRARESPGEAGPPGWSSSPRERRAFRCRLGGEERWIAAEDAGLYRDALGVAPPGGLPAAFLEDVPDALARLLRAVRAHARAVRDRRGAGALRRRRRARRSRELEHAGELVRGELRPGGTEREWCDPEVLRRLRRASLAVLRKEIEPVEPARARALRAGLAGRRPYAPAGAGADRLREVLAPLQGLRAAARALGDATCCRVASARTRRPGWTSSAPPASSCGSAPGALGGRTGARRPLLPRRRALAGPAAARPSRRRPSVARGSP